MTCVRRYFFVYKEMLTCFATISPVTELEHESY